MTSILRILLISVFFVPSVLADSTHLVMGTGGVTGVYYPAGGALCQMVNAQRSEHGMRCYVESTQGSVQNLKRLRAGDIDLAIVQSDWKIHAWRGTSEFKDYGADENLRTVLSLYREPFTIVARKDSNISTLEDLKGKRVNIGNEGSGQRATMEWLMKVLRWWKSDFSEVYEYDSEDQAQALCDDKFDAMIFVAGTPNSSVKQATTLCESVIVPVQSERLDEEIARSGVYVKTFIPGGVYRGNSEDVPTFGMAATLVSAARVDEGAIEALVKSVMDDLNAFRRLHPALGGLAREELMMRTGDVEWHKGMQRYLENDEAR